MTAISEYKVLTDGERRALAALKFDLAPTPDDVWRPSPFNVPDLQDKGYTLLGGRLLADNGKPAGLLVYEDANKQRMSVFFAANDAKNEAPMMVKQRGNVVTCYWVESDMIYAVAGEQPTDKMVSLANAVHEGFDKT